MFKRTKGYVLLTLLVLTGLAGRVTTETLNSKERRLLINSLKDTRAALLGSVKGLSQKQLDYKPKKGALSIRQHLHHIAMAEHSFSALAEKALKQPAKPAPSSHMSDEAIALQLARECAAPENSGPSAPSPKTEEEALHHFKEIRAKAIKYIKTTTQDVRAHTTPLPAGHVDAYQIYLGMSIHQALHTRQIKEIMASPGFPKK